MHKCVCVCVCERVGIDMLVVICVRECVVCVSMCKYVYVCKWVSVHKCVCMCVSV